MAPGTDHRLGAIPRFHSHAHRTANVAAMRR